MRLCCGVKCSKRRTAAFNLGLAATGLHARTPGDANAGKRESFLSVAFVTTYVWSDSNWTLDNMHRHWKSCQATYAPGFQSLCSVLLGHTYPPQIT